MFTNVNKIAYNITQYNMMSTKIFKSFQRSIFLSLSF